MRLDAHCPACAVIGLDYVATKLDMPYFGDVLQMVFVCDRCGFRHTDFVIGRAQEPTRWVHEVKAVEDLNARVVRSTSGTVRIPELGVLIEPGPASDAYVTNVEGVLDRVEGIVRQLCRDTEEVDQQEECRKRLAQLAEAREGRFRFTFILDDPNGNSLVVHESAKSHRIAEELAKELKRGEITLQLKEEVLGGAGNGHHEEPNH